MERETDAHAQSCLYDSGTYGWPNVDWTQYSEEVQAAVTHINATVRLIDLYERVRDNLRWWEIGLRLRVRDRIRYLERELDRTLNTRNYLVVKELHERESNA